MHPPLPDTGTDSRGCIKISSRLPGAPCLVISYIAAFTLKKEPGDVTFSKKQIPESGKEILPEVEN
jgi:hypothetical protein